MVLDNKISSLIPIIRGLVRDQIIATGRDPFVYETDNKFVLCRSYIDASTIEVCLPNGDTLPDQDWEFNSSKNIVEINIISSGIAINEGDLIIITYSYYQKFSDAEITQYLQSALTYFAAHRYKKVFCISSDECIVALNNLQPTKRELYFICIISSILVDPQNVKIRTDEFSISAIRDMSDTEQISDAFARYQKFVGEVDTIDTNDRGWY